MILIRADVTADSALSDWRPWFAWHPVTVQDTSVRWLETVLRKGGYHDTADMYGPSVEWRWEYTTVSSLDLAKEK
jgi:hypothetical protein